MNESGKITSSINNTICRISFYHPKSNSMPGNLLRELALIIESAGNNPDVRVIILQSEGSKAFCAGASFDELSSINDFETGKKFFMGFANVINAIRKAPKFVLGRIHGKAIGGGVGLAAACDYTFAAEAASIRLSEFALGIGPFVIGPVVERKTGTAAFAQISTDADFYDAKWAFEKGLYSKLFPTIDELDDNLNEFAAKLSKMSPEASFELKQVFWQGTENWPELLESRAEISGRLVLSDFTKNYLKEFKEK